MNIKIDYSLQDSGGYAKITSDKDSSFVEEVNKRLGDYWVMTGRERDIESVMFEVLADKYDEIVGATYR